VGLGYSFRETAKPNIKSLYHVVFILLLGLYLKFYRLRSVSRDELLNCERVYYLYEGSCLLYGFCTDGAWQFGLKVSSTVVVHVVN
jgi:hypothetical protein